MASEPDVVPGAEGPTAQNGVELPRPTAAPLVVAVGMALLAAGAVLSVAFLIVGGVVLAVGVVFWVSDLLPGRGHVHEPLVEPERRPRTVTARPGIVEQLRPGLPGYRLRLPEEVHPISAGIKGGLVGGLVMPLPALLYGLLSGHGIWYPVNLLAGMVLPGMGDASAADLEQFHAGLLLVGVVIHALMSVILGLMYGVLLPTLPAIPSPVAWGGLLMPLLWTGVSFALMGIVNPVLQRGVDWPMFIASQFVFGVAAAVVVMRAKQLTPVRAGLLGGAVGGLLMAVPAVLWGLATGRGPWYPVNLLAGMVLPGLGELPPERLGEFRAEWLAVGLAIHAVLSLGFGVLYGVLLPRLRPIPGSLAWGGLLFPLLWTGIGYELMGVVNPLLQRYVDWPWFVVSQFVFGVAAAVVVDRSVKIHIPPAGRGPDRAADFVTG